MSNSAERVKFLPQVNDPAEFVSELPTPVARAGRRWEVNLESLLFRAVYGNVQHLEEYGPHLIGWPCRDFMRSACCCKYDPAKPETFPSREEIESAYNVEEKRVDELRRYGDMGMLARALTSLVEMGAAADNPCRRKIEFSVGGGSELQIEGDGEAALLVSKAFADWVGLTDVHGPMVHFGRRHNPYYRLLDFSTGLAADGKRPCVEGTVRDPLAVSRVRPSRIHVMVSFNGDHWSEKRLRIVPWQDPGISSRGDVSEHYFYKAFDWREPVRVPLSDDVCQVKIRLVDQLGRTLRLVSNLEHPSVATLTFKPIAPSMPGTRETTISESPKDVHSHYFHPPLDNGRGTWQAGLRNVFIPSDIDWVEDNDLDYDMRIDVEGEDSIFLDPPPGRAFRSARSLIASLEGNLKRRACERISLRLSPKGRVTLSLKKGVTLTMYRKFAAVLGLENVDFANDQVVLKSTTTGSRRVDVTKVYPACIAVRCNIVKPSVLGENMEHVLGVVPTSSTCGTAGSTIFYQARKPVFVDVTGSHIANYQLSLISLPERRPIRFREGIREELFAQVSFREKTSR